MQNISFDLQSAASKTKTLNIGAFWLFSNIFPFFLQKKKFLAKFDLNSQIQASNCIFQYIYLFEGEKKTSLKPDTECNMLLERKKREEETVVLMNKTVVLI